MFNFESMKIEKIKHPSGFEQEVIILFPDEDFCDYIVFKNDTKPGYSIIEIDRCGGFEKEIDYDFLKTLTDDKIFKIFFPD